MRARLKRKSEPAANAAGFPPLGDENPWGPASGIFSAALSEGFQLFSCVGYSNNCARLIICAK